MKKILLWVLMMALLVLMAGCGQKKEEVSAEPEISRMRAICELATIDCYYHNVAKDFEPDVEKTLWWSKDRHFWVEYGGVVTLGIDVSKVTMEVSGDRVIITMPEAQVLRCKVDSSTLTADSYIVDKDSVEITAADEIVTLEKSVRDMEQKAAQDEILLSNARQRAQTLLEEYVKNIGAAVGKEYIVEWRYLEEASDVSPDGNEGPEEP